MNIKSLRHELVRLISFSQRLEEWIKNISEHQDFNVKEIIHFLELAPTKEDVAEKGPYLRPDATLALIQLLLQKSDDVPLVCRTILKKNVRTLLKDEFNWDELPEFLNNAVEKMPMRARLDLFIEILTAAQDEVSGYVQANQFTEMAQGVLMCIYPEEQPARSVKQVLSWAVQLSTSDVNGHGAWELEHLLEHFIGTAKHLRNLIKKK